MPLKQFEIENYLFDWLNFSCHFQQYICYIVAVTACILSWSRHNIIPNPLEPLSKQQWAGQKEWILSYWPSSILGEKKNGQVSNSKQEFLVSSMLQTELPDLVQGTWKNYVLGFLYAQRVVLCYVHGRLSSLSWVLNSYSSCRIYFKLATISLYDV